MKNTVFILAILLLGAVSVVLYGKIQTIEKKTLCQGFTRCTQNPRGVCAPGAKCT